MIKTKANGFLNHCLIGKRKKIGNTKIIIHVEAKNHFRWVREKNEKEEPVSGIYFKIQSIMVFPGVNRAHNQPQQTTE